MLKRQAVGCALEQHELEGVVGEVGGVGAPEVGHAGVLREGDQALGKGEGGAVGVGVGGCLVEAGDVDAGHGAPAPWRRWRR